MEQLTFVKSYFQDEDHLCLQFQYLSEQNEMTCGLLQRFMGCLPENAPSYEKISLQIVWNSTGEMNTYNSIYILKLSVTYPASTEQILYNVLNILSQCVILMIHKKSQMSVTLAFI